MGRLRPLLLRIGVVVVVVLLRASSLGGTTIPEGGPLVKQIRGYHPSLVPAELREPLAMGQQLYLTLTLII